MQDEYIVIGAYPGKERLADFHGGGQLTATVLLVEYAEENDILLNIIDTTHNVFPAPTLKSKIIESKKRIQKLLRLLKSKQISGVIIFSGSGFSFYEKIFMSFLVKIKKVQVLFFIRSGHFMTLSNKNRFIKKIHKIFLNIPTYLGAQGKKWIHFYEEMGIEKSNIKLLPNWIRIDEKLEYKTTNEKVVFLYAGWMVEKKGVLELFDVIEMHDDLKPYTFKFAGGGTLLEELKIRKEKNHLENVEILGWVDTEDMYKYYESSDVFILPSHAEGFPNVILEALNYGLPIISTDVGGISDSVIDEHNGLIFNIKDKDMLYKHILSLALSKEKRESFSHKGKNILKERHEFKQNCQLVFDVFKDKS